MDGHTSDRPHGSTGQGPGGLGRTPTKMIGDGSSAEEYDEMVDEDVKRMIDLATKL